MQLTSDSVFIISFGHDMFRLDPHAPSWLFYSSPWGYSDWLFMDFVLGSCGLLIFLHVLLLGLDKMYFVVVHWLSGISQSEHCVLVGFQCQDVSEIRGSFSKSLVVEIMCHVVQGVFASVTSLKRPNSAHCRSGHLLSVFTLVSWAVDRHWIKASWYIETIFCRCCKSFSHSRIKLPNHSLPTSLWANAWATIDVFCNFYSLRLL